MDLRTSLAGRVRNTSLPKSHPLLPLMEAVVNGLQAIDSFYGGMEGGRLTVTVERSPQQVFDLGSPTLEPIVGFNVTDNGEGFTPANMESFQTLDSDFKSALGCRGVGRLLWLKAFDRVEVDSTYRSESGESESVSFRFSERDGVVYRDPVEIAIDTFGSSVSLIGFRERYRGQAPKRPDVIARTILEHCLWYFLREGGAPDIRLIDCGELFSLNRMFEELVAARLTRSSLHVKGNSFDLVGLRARSANTTAPKLCWCAASRVVQEENLTGRVPGLHGRMRDDDDEFTFIGYVSSDYLDANVRSDRTAFDIPDSNIGTLVEDEPSLQDIRQAAFAEIQQLLASPLAEALTQGKERVVKFVSTTAPRYRPLLRRFESLGLAINPAIPDKELELQLHAKLRDLEVEALTESHEILSEVEAGMGPEQQLRLQEYLAKISEIKQSDLTAYVSTRRVVLDLLQKLIETDPEGRYAREDAIHQLLMPMRKDSNEVTADASNLWIIDERLAFHDYLASDKPLRSMPITGSGSTKEPDLLSTRLIDAPFLVSEGSKMPLTSISVVEIKRPMRNDANNDDKDPIGQALRYIQLVREGGLLTATGRPVSGTKAPGFCYVLADLTPTMLSRCKFHDLNPTHDGQGYFGYHNNLDTYIEVISFDRLLNSAKERNRAFFDKLGLPAT